MALPQAAWRTPGARRSHPTYGTLFACTVVMFVSGLFAFNNLAIYLGLPHGAAIKMFSGLQARNGDSNHFLLPSLTLSDSASYVSSVRVVAGKPNIPEISEFQTFATSASGRGFRLNLDFVRYHVNRMCQAAPKGSLGLAFKTAAGETLDFENVCSQPALRQYWPIGESAACYPGCDPILERWARARALNK